jgi:hypothetical protein
MPLIQLIGRMEDNTTTKDADDTECSGGRKNTGPLIIARAFDSVCIKVKLTCDLSRQRWRPASSTTTGRKICGGCYGVASFFFEADSGQSLRARQADADMSLNKARSSERRSIIVSACEDERSHQRAGETNRGIVEIKLAPTPQV